MPRPDIYEDDRLWAADTFHSIGEQTRFRVAASLLGDDVSSLLDVGAGNGAFLAHLELTTQLTLHGLEPSSSARGARVCRAPIDAGLAEQLPYPDDAFDAVSALEVIEHLGYHSYQGALDEVRRVAGRYVLISVPYRERTDPTRCPQCGCRFHPNYHMRRFDRETMTTLLHPMHLEHVRLVSDLDYLGGDVLRWAYHKIAPGSMFPMTSVCPQCGFRGDDLLSGQLGSAYAVRQSLASRLRGRLPTVKKPRWIVGLYGH